MICYKLSITKPAPDPRHSRDLFNTIAKTLQEIQIFQIVHGVLHWVDVFHQLLVCTWAALVQVSTDVFENKRIQDASSFTVCKGKTVLVLCANKLGNCSFHVRAAPHSAAPSRDKITVSTATTWTANRLSHKYSVILRTFTRPFPLTNVYMKFTTIPIERLSYFYSQAARMRNTDTQFQPGSHTGLKSFLHRLFAAEYTAYTHQSTFTGLQAVRHLFLFLKQVQSQPKKLFPHKLQKQAPVSCRTSESTPLALATVVRTFPLQVELFWWLHVSRTWYTGCVQSLCQAHFWKIR